MNYSLKVLHRLGLNNKQIELLILVMPYPFGQGLRQIEAAQSLQITQSVISTRLRNIRKNKKVWGRLNKWIELSYKDKDKIDCIKRIDYMNSLDKIKEKF